MLFVLLFSEWKSIVTGVGLMIYKPFSLNNSQFTQDFFVQKIIVPLCFVFIRSSSSSYFFWASLFLFVFRFGNLNPLNSCSFSVSIRQAQTYDWVYTVLCSSFFNYHYSTHKQWSINIWMFIFQNENRSSLSMSFNFSYVSVSKILFKLICCFSSLLLANRIRFIHVCILSVYSVFTPSRSAYACVCICVKNGLGFPETKPYTNSIKVALMVMKPTNCVLL